MLMKEIKVQYLHQVCAAEEDPVRKCGVGGTES